MGEAKWLQRMSTKVRIPSGHGDYEARSYMRLALGQWYRVLRWVVRQGFWGGNGWW